MVRNRATHIHNLSNVSKIFEPIMFADDTDLFFSHKNIKEMFHTVNSELSKVFEWFNPFHATDLFWYPWKHEKTRGFLTFSGGIKRDQWHEMG